MRVINVGIAEVGRPTLTADSMTPLAGLLDSIKRRKQAEHDTHLFPTADAVTSQLPAPAITLPLPRWNVLPLSPNPNKPFLL